MAFFLTFENFLDIEKMLNVAIASEDDFYTR